VNTVGRSVGRYDILRVIGRGGMATVFLAHQRDLDRDIALKELALFEGSQPALARRFLREARLAGSFSHPNIVTVHDYIEHDGMPYIAMEYMVRGSLRPYAGRLSLAQVGGVLEGLLGGLGHAAERGVVHRDLKPENLMVTSQGRVKIADFGIAKATSAANTNVNLTTTGTTLGTPRYMAPERAMGQAIGPESDLYSVGVMVFELLVGHTPFHDTDVPMALLMRHINEEIPPVRSLVPDVDPALSDWVQRLLIKDPAARTRSAVTAWDELDVILIDLLGPRWLRDSALPARPGGATAPVPTPTPATRRLVAPPPVAAATTNAATLAPSTPPTGRPRRGGRRIARLSRLALLVTTAAAAVAFSAGALQNDAPKTTGGAAPTVDVQPDATSQRAALAEATTPAAKQEAATALADEYDRAAARLDPGADRQAVAALDAVAGAYRQAADAARREDGSDYDDALATAHAREAAIDGTPPANSGVGDSQSDDPSDDEPDEDDNGD